MHPRGALCNGTCQPLGEALPSRGVITGRSRHHAEAVEIIFDPAKTSCRTLLEQFFQMHDPSTRARQGGDRGARYRSAMGWFQQDQPCPLMSKNEAKKPTTVISRMKGCYMAAVSPTGPPPMMRQSCTWVFKPRPSSVC